MLSPWQRVLGEEFDELHPRLRSYFDEIPRGSIGLGEGEFDAVGTPRPWLRTLFRLAVDSDVLFDSRVVDGGLVLSSTRVALRVGRRHIVIPQCISSRVHLSERFSDVDDRQHVSLTMHFTLVGRVYEYAGSFRYRITSEAS